MSRYDTAMAAEFYVLSMLYRLGIEASLTLGNKKAVDITVTRALGDIVTIDVKGIRGKTSWPIHDRYRKRSHYYVFVTFLDRIDKPAVQPEVYIVPSTSIPRLKYRNRTSGREFIQLRCLREGQRERRYRDNWEVFL